MKPFFKFPFIDQVEHNLSFVRKSTSFAYVMTPDEVNYGNALYETLQILGSIPVKNAEEMGYTLNELKEWNEQIRLNPEYEDQDFEIAYSVNQEHYVFPLLNIYFNSYQLSVLTEDAFIGVENTHVGTLISEAYRLKKDDGCAVIVTNVISSPFIKKTDADMLFGANLADIMIFAAQQLLSILAVIVPENDALLRARLQACGYKPLKTDSSILLKEPLLDA